VLHFLWGTDWILKYYSDELRLQRVKKFVLAHLFYLYTFCFIIFCNPSCSTDHLNEAHTLLVVCRPLFGNLWPRPTHPSLLISSTDCLEPCWHAHPPVPAPFVSIPVQPCTSAHLQAINKYSTNPVQIWCPHKPQPLTLLHRILLNPADLIIPLLCLCWLHQILVLNNLPRAPGLTAWSLGVLFVICPCLTQWPAHWCAYNFWTNHKCNGEKYLPWHIPSIRAPCRWCTVEEGDTDEHPAWYFLARKLIASFISGKSCSFTNTTPGLSIKGNNYTKPYKL
jgi:hypothetical protein